MVNLNAIPDRTKVTDEAARTYGTYMLPRLLARASYPILTTNVTPGLANTLGQDVGKIERLVVVRYRSRRDFLNIIATQEFREAVLHKSVSLDGWYSAPSPAAPVLSVPLLALVTLLAIGALGTVWRRRSRLTIQTQFEKSLES